MNEPINEESNDYLNEIINDNADTDTYIDEEINENIQHLESKDLDESSSSIYIDDNLSHAESRDTDESINNESNDINVKDEFSHEVDEDELMLTTMDNPFNPKLDYELWSRWDHDNHYNTEEYIARLISMEDDYDVDDDFMTNILTSKVISDILENDDQEIYRLI